MHAVRHFPCSCFGCLPRWRSPALVVDFWLRGSIAAGPILGPAPRALVVVLEPQALVAEGAHLIPGCADLVRQHELSSRGSPSFAVIGIAHKLRTQEHAGNRQLPQRRIPAGAWEPRALMRIELLYAQGANRLILHETKDVSVSCEPELLGGSFLAARFSARCSRVILWLADLAATASARVVTLLTVMRKAVLCRYALATHAWTCASCRRRKSLTAASDGERLVAVPLLRYAAVGFV